MDRKGGGCQGTDRVVRERQRRGRDRKEGVSEDRQGGE
jgi:hypothetical protein